MRTLKIGYDAKRSFHNFRGLGNYSRTLISGVARYYPQHHYYLYTTPYTETGVTSWHQGHQNIHLVKPKGMATLFPNLWRSRYVTNNILNDKLDIYHGLSHELPANIKKTGAKAIVTIHDLIFMRYPQFFPWLDRQVYKHKFTTSCRQADLIIAISEQTKTDLTNMLAIPAEKITVVNQGVNPIFFKEKDSLFNQRLSKQLKLPPSYLLSVGTIEERKNTKQIVRALKKLQHTIDHHLVLVGKGKQYKQEVLSLAQELGIVDRVLVLSNINDDQLKSIYEQADVFIFPSLFEGWGLPIVESLLAKTPVITSCGSCFMESGGKHSLYINPQDEVELSQAIIRVLQDKELQQTMIHKGYQHAQKFTHQKVTDNLMQAYEQVVAE